MTADELSDCDDYFGSYTFDTGTTATAFCEGTGTVNEKTFQEILDSNEFQDNIEDLLEINAIKLEYTNGTSSEWVNGRTVLTTSEWNSLGTNSISFKIRAESNEGIWVEEPVIPVESYPNCKFIYTRTPIYTTWNTNSLTSYIDPNTLSESYIDVVEESSKNYFLGLVTNGCDEITKAYACGVKDNLPFCIEGYSDNTYYSINSSLINGASLWNGTCTVDTEYGYTECGTLDVTNLSARAYSNGSVGVGIDNNNHCYIVEQGAVHCLHNGGS